MLWPSGFLPASVMAAVVLQLAVVTVSSTEMPDALNQNDQLNIKGRLMAVDCNEGRLTTVDCVEGCCGFGSRRAVPNIVDHFNSTVMPGEHLGPSMLPAGGLTATERFFARLVSADRLRILATPLDGIPFGLAMVTAVTNMFSIANVAAVLTACMGLVLLAFNIHFKLEMCTAVLLAYWCSALWIGWTMSTLAGSALVVVAMVTRWSVLLFMDAGTAGTAVADADAPAAPAESDLDRVRRQIREVDEDLTELRAEKRQANAKGDKITKAEIEVRIDKKEELLKSLTDRATGLEALMGRGTAAAAPAATEAVVCERPAMFQAASSIDDTTQQRICRMWCLGNVHTHWQFAFAAAHLSDELSVEDRCRLGGALGGLVDLSKAWGFAMELGDAGLRRLVSIITPGDAVEGDTSDTFGLFRHRKQITGGNRHEQRLSLPITVAFDQFLSCLTGLNPGVGRMLSCRAEQYDEGRNSQDFVVNRDYDDGTLPLVIVEFAVDEGKADGDRKERQLFHATVSGFWVLSG